MSTVEELIARLEKATGPDRESDLECWWYGKANNDGQPMDADYRKANLTMDDAPRYTSSIDAALTLLGDDSWEWNLAWNSGFAFAEVGDPLLYLEGEAKTPALALCIAALKARQEVK